MQTAMTVTRFLEGYYNNPQEYNLNTSFVPNAGIIFTRFVIHVSNSTGYTANISTQIHTCFSFHYQHIVLTKENYNVTFLLPE